MGKKKEVTIGYKYFLGVHFCLSHGQLDALTHITVDDRLAWSGSNAGGSLTISKENLFGGEKREGGISGTVYFMPGTPTAMQNGYLASKVSSDVPAYRRIANVVLRQTYMGTNPYLKKWAFRVRRIMKKSDGSTQWYSAKAAIGQDMNPAHIIRECLTDQDWGMGYLDSDIDEAAFIQAADTLYAEGFGMSVLWDKQATIEDFIKDVLRHIEASLYVSKSTGLFTIYLIRDNYSVSSLRTLDETNVVKVEDYTCSTFTELSNSVTVNYWDASTGKTGSVTVQDTALIQLQGATVSVTQEYGGCANGALAVKLASRDLKALSTPITRCTVYATRFGSTLIPGEPVKFNWPEYGVTNMVMRVAAIDFGSATDNDVKVTLVQDVFSIGTATYAPPADTEWVPVSNDPQPVADRALIEAPYYMLVRYFGESEVNTWLAEMPTAGYVVSAGKRPTGDSLNALMHCNAGAGYAEDALLDFCTYGVTTTILSKSAGSVNLVGVSDMYDDMIAVGDYALINNEIVEVTGFAEASLSFKRGVLDTVPAQHAAGSKVFVLSRNHGLGDTEYLSGETVSVKLLTATGRGVLDIGSAPSSSVTMAARAIRPYPPGAWTISGSQFPASVIDAPVTTAWAHRSRTQQTGANLVDFSEGSVGPEAGTSYSLRLYNNDTSVLLYSVDSLTGTAHSGFPAMTGQYNLRMELWSVRDGYASTYKHSHVFYYENVYRLTMEDASGHLITEGGDTLSTE